MKAIARALWNYPTVFAGAVQAANATLAAAGVLPPLVALGISTVAAVCNFVAVTPSNPK
jgi:hypothetical protein